MTSGSTALLVDTNIPVYAVDPRDPSKQQRAMDVLDGVRFVNPFDPAFNPALL